MKSVIKGMLKYLIVLITSLSRQAEANCECLSQNATACFFRNERIARRESLPVYLDRVYIGSTSAQAILCVPLSTGIHQLSSDKDFYFPQELVVEADKTYLIWQEVKFSSNGISSKLHLLYNSDVFWGRTTCTCDQSPLQQ